MSVNTWFRALVIVCAAVGVLNVSACASWRQADTPEAHERMLRKRAQERWDAVIALDFDKVYTYASPAYRAVHEPRHLKSRYAAQINRIGYQVTSVEFDAEDPATATVVGSLEFEAYGIGPGGKSLRTNTRVVDTWVLRDRKWWFVEPN